MNDKKFYVYEWYNIDTDEIFYVGKGTGSRWKSKHGRNKYFLNYINKYNCNVRKIKNNLTEEEALQLEEKIIDEYKSKNQCKCNFLSGGPGGLSNTKNEKFRIARKICYKNTSKFTHMTDFTYSELLNMNLDELILLEEEFDSETEGRKFLKAMFDSDIPDTYEWFFAD